MPELPEVETIRRGLERTVEGLEIKNVEIIDGRVVRAIGLSAFRKKLQGRSIRHIFRRGKALVFDCDGLCLVVQPMMTGQLVAMRNDQRETRSKDTKVVFGLSKGWRLLYNDQRIFGRLQIVNNAEDLPYIHRLGPEPLADSFTADELFLRLQTRKSVIKTVLMDATFIAGIGNIYAAEALFRARIDPRKHADCIGSGDARRLFLAIRSVLNEALALGGTTVRNYIGGDGQSGKFQDVVQVYGRAGQPCRVCGGEITRIVQTQRSTFYCPYCQAE